MGQEPYKVDVILCHIWVRVLRVLEPMESDKISVHLSMAKAKKTVVRTTKEGRVYIRTKDFFKQDRVQVLVRRLKDSSIVKTIEKEKLSEQREVAASE